MNVVRRSVASKYRPAAWAPGPGAEYLRELMEASARLPGGRQAVGLSPAEVRLIEPLLTHRMLARLPKRLVYDLAADSDPLRQRLKERGIELFAPTARIEQNRQLKTVAS